MRYGQGVRSLVHVPLGLALLRVPALAQRAAENAVMQSSDTFGCSVASDRTGLDTSEDDPSAQYS